MKDETRLREHPVIRFDEDVHQLDLKELSNQLEAEPHDATHGHRQMAVYHYGSVTMVLFSFAAGGELKEHKASGVVTIHVLEGQLDVGAEGISHKLSAGQILVLAPNVIHDVNAQLASRMLLTVHLHGKKHDDAPHRD